MSVEIRAAIPGASPRLPLKSSTSEVASLVRSFDWSQTPLGPIESWPQSLRTVVGILLTSRYAMWMGWGEELTFLYNDAYRPTLGIKHPWAFGQPASKVWAEIWRDISPRIQAVMSAGEATYDEALLLFLERSGFPEETYHTFSYSPLSDDDGRLNGLFCVVTEETDRIISERRMTTLRHLSEALTAANSEDEVLIAAERQLGVNQLDLPFTITYLLQADGPARLFLRDRHHPRQTCGSSAADRCKSMTTPICATMCGVCSVRITPSPLLPMAKRRSLLLYKILRTSSSLTS